MKKVDSAVLNIDWLELDKLVLVHVYVGIKFELHLQNVFLDDVRLFLLGVHMAVGLHDELVDMDCTEKSLNLRFVFAFYTFSVFAQNDHRRDSNPIIWVILPHNPIEIFWNRIEVMTETRAKVYIGNVYSFEPFWLAHSHWVDCPDFFRVFYNLYLSYKSDVVVKFSEVKVKGEAARALHSIILHYMSNDWEFN